ncbi:hypothetical protein [Pseudomonas sp. B21-048]|uniref:hypothetical protein n=1 Tax=Pseudomonas sp. B21-048 TaxID=2895490 RepID=UPI00215EEEF3|nr:hypothetical protein [Pseudomonas sp. B21-048]UVK96734.1 hypothetical protein LOY56_15155 [Pseudomonas sp. B21-048]
MAKRADRSMLLTLSEQETKTLRDIIKPKVEGPERMSLPKRVLCGLSAVFLFALVVLGMVKPDMAIAIAKLAGLLLELWF